MAALKRTDKIPGDDIVNSLNAKNAIIIGFTVDPLGAIGPAARRMLYGHPDKDNPPNYATAFPSYLSPAARLMIQRATGPESVQNTLVNADRAWRATHGHRWYGTTYAENTPSTYARALLGTTITRALTDHIHRNAHNNLSAFARPSKKPPVPYGGGSRWTRQRPTPLAEYVQNSVGAFRFGTTTRPTAHTDSHAPEYNTQNSACNIFHIIDDPN